MQRGVHGNRTKFIINTADVVVTISSSATEAKHSPKDKKAIKRQDNTGFPVISFHFWHHWQKLSWHAIKPGFH